MKTLSLHPVHTVPFVQPALSAWPVRFGLESYHTPLCAASSHPVRLHVLRLLFFRALIQICRAVPFRARVSSSAFRDDAARHRQCAGVAAEGTEFVDSFLLAQCSQTPPAGGFRAANVVAYADEDLPHAEGRDAPAHQCERHLAFQPPNRHPLPLQTPRQPSRRIQPLSCRAQRFR